MSKDVRAVVRYGTQIASACLVAGTLPWIVGCGRDAPFPLAAVEGTVTYQGKPLERGRVVFFPTGGTPGPTAVGTIGPNGAFRIQTLGRNGAAIGRHRVTVHLTEQLTEEQVQQVDRIAPKSLIPEKYSNPGTSGLFFDVHKGENVYRIELVGPGWPIPPRSPAATAP